MTTNLISIVSPVFNEQEVIQDFLKETQENLKKDSYEIILIDDGSTDNTPDILKAIVVQNPKIKAIRFTRNFGQQAAIMAGLRMANGKAIIVMDSDLQDPPQYIPQLIKKWEEGYKIVYAKRLKRRDSFLKKFTASIFYKLLHFLTDTKMPKNTGDFYLLDRKVVNELKQLPEKFLYFRGLTGWLGFKQSEIEIIRPKRMKGTTGYTLKKMMRLATDSLLSFSNKPLRAITYLGMIVLMTGIVLGLALLFKASLFKEQTLSPILLVTIIILSGLNLISLGIISEYLSRIFFQTQDRPLYVIEETYGFKKE
ncbi:TPA: glycosyltransferase [candidate division CPR2 bacterium]|uniref:Glycosyltransferase n=1 Tax=candidate division CPR2 bacterium GW2011_GWC1_41_48 TaxID=1618344 RepID=A0A0G0Z7Z3_UNCC2|nr:MAG: glycosyltransferase [candidate division CPR2 bacterium GW2011_GWC2_39_35]KKR28016.1 MAG: glycosyltransferase [candidate division CPR2 bacterium GW2011_GWD1_39_7]KKR29223.1 MAG: glycosyltransferase [candidate division CPR2 bacterium GW2011_GWD2_39_7]KKS09133.1 MAG: glycosyltransferase [candidate division CPR2 bacterium GW2011_GWC1_41_48]OGB60245.1 MAG: hypothetical protein A2Y27_02825 [candidate division CPR2 bacterium GWD1_39_7]OGB70777.1 MAG: hypothetical protein A2Y26_02775 [candidat